MDSQKYCSKEIEIRTELEHELHKCYSEEKAKREELQCVVLELQAQVEKLKETLKCYAELEKKNATNQEADKNESSPKHMEYMTDEEELARETEWIRVKSRKKRKLNNSITPPKQANHDNEKGIQKPKKIPPPPPIVVEGIKNYQSFYDSIACTQPGESFTVKMLSGDRVKLNGKNKDSYREITKLLESNMLRWHSYENKQARPIRVMAKKLHHTCQPERIVEHLKQKGYKIQNAVNKLSWKKKEPLNMFILSFENDEDVNKVYGIKNILGCKVEIHPLKTSKLIPQCKRCQAYGHTQKYCAKEPRCVKCTGKHLTKDCQKPKEEKPKCVHCGESHPANYRGCIVAKEMQEIKNKQNKKQPSSLPKSTVPLSQGTIKAKKANQNALINSQTSMNPLSYSQAVKGKAEASLESKLDKVLSLISTFDERLQKLETGTKVANNRQQQ